jgi:hypothetical protein
LGAGVAADPAYAHAYAHAFRIPTQVLLRYWVPTDTGAFVVQPGCRSTRRREGRWAIRSRLVLKRLRNSAFP